MRVVITGSDKEICTKIGEIFKRHKLEYIDTGFYDGDLHDFEGRLECSNRLKKIKYYEHRNLYISFQFFFQRTLVGNSFDGYDYMVAIRVFSKDIIDVERVLEVPFHLVDKDIMDDALEKGISYREAHPDWSENKDKQIETVCYEILKIINSF